ncbi:hypothetical protein OUZ56_017698 [Daphnia magna]|uniref:Secreted protein n=1 Tax=Daphnia magna TaxID=35525 RepID=A0ABR0ATI1_9CRUS|nr:hypothetical protein OUZ56_017698 [Daphnia magna]
MNARGMIRPDSLMYLTKALLISCWVFVALLSPAQWLDSEGQAGSSSLWNRAKFAASLLCPDRNLNRVLVTCLDLCMCHLSMPVLDLRCSRRIASCSPVESRLHISLVATRFKDSFTASWSALSLPGIPT